MQALGKIVEHVRTLCQDLQYTVRECMCASVIVPLARSLGPDEAATNVLEDILELIQVLRKHALAHTALIRISAPPLNLLHTAFPSAQNSIN
jgi:hypothetical protein